MKHLLILLSITLTFDLSVTDAADKEVSGLSKLADVAATVDTSSDKRTTLGVLTTDSIYINWSVLSDIGGDMESSRYKVRGTGGQSPVGRNTVGSVPNCDYVNPGFWQVFTTCCIGTTGNVNMAGIVDVSDLSMLVAYLTSGPCGITLLCEEEANVDTRGRIDVSDLSWLVAYLTGSGSGLPDCLILY